MDVRERLIIMEVIGEMDASCLDHEECRGGTIGCLDDDCICDSGQ